MPDKLYFNVNFYKTRNKIDISSELSIDEKQEALDKAIDIIEILIFFATNAPKKDLIDVDSYEIFLFELRNVIKAFIDSARFLLIDLENRREELEKHFAVTNTD